MVYMDIHKNLDRNICTLVQYASGPSILGPWLLFKISCSQLMSTYGGS